MSAPSPEDEGLTTETGSQGLLMARFEDKHNSESFCGARNETDRGSTSSASNLEELCCTMELSHPNFITAERLLD
jgi:hypothetical protein